MPTRHLIHRRPTLHGFTLVELLVVITIIVVLLALLMPALDRAVAAAEAVVCGTNLRGTSQAFYWYESDFRRAWIAPWDAENFAGGNGQGAPAEWYTTWTVGVTLGSWAWQWPYVMIHYTLPGEKLRPVSGGGTAPGFYAGQTLARHATGKGFLHCPTTYNEWKPGAALGIFSTHSYGIIGKDRYGAYSILGYPKRTRFASPATLVHMQDWAWVGTLDASGNTTAKAEPAPNVWADYNSVATDPHIDRSNYLFADGHVERLQGRWTAGPGERAQATPPIDRGGSDLRRDAFKSEGQ